MFRYIVLLCLLFGSAEGARERILGDVNGDGKVDILDFILLSRNYGRTGGAMFDPVNPDTIFITVRDSIFITVRDTTTLAEPRIKLKPRVLVAPGDWSVPQDQIQASLNQVIDIGAEMLMFPLDSDIHVHKWERDHPRIFYKRTPYGVYNIAVADRYIVSVIVAQFAHEYGHIITNYYQTRFSDHQWLEESMATAIEYHILKRYRTIVTEGDDPLTKPSLLGLYAFIRNIELANPYKEEGYDALMKDPWVFRDKMQLLIMYSSNTNWKRGGQYTQWIALNLMKVFEDSPEAFNVFRYMNMRGPIIWDETQEDFETYLRGWYQRTPQRWQKHVLNVAWMLGYDRNTIIDVSALSDDRGVN